jgi:hypothetical protein
MVRELVGCLDDGMDHPAEVEVVLDLASERRGVVVEDEGEGKECGNAKDEGVPEEGMVVVDIHRRWYDV